MHINGQGRNKLDPKSKKSTFISYGEDEFGYCLWAAKNKNMIHSRDVIFNERVMYKDRHSTNTRDSDVLKYTYVDLDDVPESPHSKELSESRSGKHSPSLRRSTQTHVPNKRLGDYVLLTD